MLPPLFYDKDDSDRDWAECVSWEDRLNHFRSAVWKTFRSREPPSMILILLEKAKTGETAATWISTFIFMAL